MPSRLPALPLSPDLARTVLAAARGSLGGIWLAPSKAGSLSGLTGRKQAPVPLLLRMFAAREVALAALLATVAPEQRRRCLQIGLAVDATDTVAAVLALRTREVPLRGALAGVAGGVGAVLLGLTALAGEQRS